MNNLTWQQLISGVPGGLGVGKFTPFALSGQRTPALPAVGPAIPAAVPAQLQVASTPPPQATAGTMSSGDTAESWDPSQYGDGQQSKISFTAAGDQIVLERPAGLRTLLILSNDSTTLTMRVAFGAAASSSYGQPLAPGGSMLLDRGIPQNDVHVYAPGVAVLQVSFVNVARP